MSGSSGPGPLTGLRVLDLSESVAGQFAARLLSDNGAQVVLGEPDSGSVIRGIGPFRSNGESLLFWHINTGKTAARVDKSSSVAETIMNFRPHVVLAPSALAASAWADQFAEVVVGVASAFSPDGPYATWTGGELVLQALSGSMHYNGASGRKPLYGAGRRISYGAGLLLYSRVIAELVGRARGAGTRGQPVRVVEHEVGVMMEQNFSSQWAYSQTIPHRGDALRPTGHVRCADGWLAFFVQRTRRAEFFRAFQAEDLLEDRRFKTVEQCGANIDDLCAELTKRVGHVSRAIVWNEALRLNIIVSPILSLKELATDEQLAARGFWHRAGSHTVLGPMWRSDGFEWKQALPAPTVATISAHPQLNVADSDWALDIPDASGASPDMPLGGLRVADFSTAWAGPLATRILATMGADVRKVEGPRQVDGWRNLRDLDLFPGRVLGERPFDRGVWFNAMNQGKRSLVVDAKTAEGLVVVKKLVRESDIVLANFSPHTLDRMGIGFDVLAAENPGLVLVEMPGFGNSGPLESHRAFGQTMEALSGIASLIGYAGEQEPLGSKSAYNDPMGALAGVAAVLTGLVRRWRDGTAQYIEVPQREAAMHWIGELVLDAIDEGTDYEPSGNAVPYAYPHDAYAVDEADNWLVVSIAAHSEWKALCGYFGWDDWAEDPVFATVEGRRAAADRIDSALSEAVLRRDAPKATVAAELQDAGIAAASVQNGRDLFHDPHLRSRGWFRSLDHPDVGVFEYPGVAIEGAAGQIIHVDTAAPRLGGHTYQILDEIDAAADFDIADLVRREIVIALPTFVGATEPSGATA
jgi:crotonobetainyl-CoA:carnitine CoA-transferase CaiB-like acyl-CoA transferase